MTKADITSTPGARLARARGCMWGVHGFVTDSKGTLYTAEVRDGRVQKYTPRKGADPDFLIGKPWGTELRTQAAR